MFGINNLDMDKLLGAVTAPTTSPPQQATFSIPADHPAADKLRKLMVHLQTAMVTPSGIHLQQRSDDPTAVAGMLSALRDVLLAEGAEVPSLDVLVQQQQVRPLTLPQLFQTVMQALNH
jgi:hypothetical protein